MLLKGDFFFFGIFKILYHYWLFHATFPFYYLFNHIVEWVGKPISTAKTTFTLKKKDTIRVKYLGDFVLTIASITIMHTCVLESIGSYLKITVQRQCNMTFQIWDLHKC